MKATLTTWLTILLAAGWSVALFAFPSQPVLQSNLATLLAFVSGFYFWSQSRDSVWHFLTFFWCLITYWAIPTDGGKLLIGVLAAFACRGYILYQRKGHVPSRAFILTAAMCWVPFTCLQFYQTHLARAEEVLDGRATVRLARIVEIGRTSGRVTIRVVRFQFLDDSPEIKRELAQNMDNDSIPLEEGDEVEVVWRASAPGVFELREVYPRDQRLAQDYAMRKSMGFVVWFSGIYLVVLGFNLRGYLVFRRRIYEGRLKPEPPRVKS